MKYQAPVGSVDPDASYVNGNPATGTEGSIVGFEAIEHPQREIITVIEAAGLVPDESDLTQLLQAVAALAPPAVSNITHGHITGLILSNDVDSDHDINVSTGQATDSGNTAYLTLASAMTKQIDAAWVVGNDVGGLFTGAVAGDIRHIFPEEANPESFSAGVSNILF